MPLESTDSQSALPHAQAAGLAEDPSDAEQVGGREQALDDIVHTSPVPEPRMLLEQSTLPHAQAAELARDPSDTEQVGGREQVLDDFVHTSPVPDP